MKSLPTNIYRVKGMVKTQDVPTPLIVNYSFGNVSFEELAVYEGESLLVFIGEKIDENVKALSEQFPFLSIAAAKHDHTHDHDTCSVDHVQA